MKKVRRSVTISPKVTAQAELRALASPNDMPETRRAKRLFGCSLTLGDESQQFFPET